MSRGFLAAMAGLAMTLFAWFGPWAWPAWPAFEVIHLMFGRAGFDDLPHTQKALLVVALIVVNSSFWAFLVFAVLRAVSRMRQNAARPVR